MKPSIRSSHSRLFLVAAVSAILFTSCAKEDIGNVNQDRVYTTYELFYDQNSNASYARAQFRFGNSLGTTLELSSPAEVRFNNDVLVFNSVLAYYEKMYPGKLTQGTFTFTDKAGKTFTNSVNGLKEVAIPADFVSVQRGQSSSLTWTGSALAANEGISATLWTNGQTNFQLFTQLSQGATSIDLQGDRLNNLVPGTNNTLAVLEWSRIDSLQSATSAGGFRKVTYRATTKTISAN